jgi:diguanylate cyclase (GGDEF)-like protein
VLALLTGAACLLLLSVVVLLVLERRRLKAEARADPLTGLPNRRGLALGWAALPPPPGLLLIDLIGFKAVNDAHGHIVGDALLKQVAGRLAAAVPRPGVLARWGGDEFAAALPAAMLERGRSLLENAVREPYDLSDWGGPSGVSIGVRMGIGEGVSDLDAALAMAASGLLKPSSAAPARRERTG